MEFVRHELALPSLEAEASSCLGGACWNEEKKCFESVWLEDLNQDTSFSDNLYVPGTTQEQIDRELQRRHPGPMPGTGYVILKDNTRLSRKSGPKYSWVITDMPIVYEPLHFDGLRRFSGKLGPVLISEAEAEELGGNYNFSGSFNAEGFTFQPSQYDGFFRVNFNPRQVANRPHATALRAYKKRMKPEFTQYVYHSLYALFHPRAWPNDHPFKGNVNAGSPVYTSSGGWGRSPYQRLNEYGLEDYQEMLRLTQKLWKEKYWRRDNHTSGYNTDAAHTSLNSILAGAYENIHAVEDCYRQKLQKERKQLRGDYRRRLWRDMLWGRKYYQEPDFPATFDEYLKQYNSGSLPKINEQLDFCRWLRKEGRAIEMPAPERPVRPLTELQQERLKQKKKRAAAKRRKARLAEKRKSS